MLWRYHIRLTLALAQSGFANRQLHSVRTQLEATIAVRTEALREREAHFRMIAELTSGYAFQVLHQIKELGITVAIDDFGAGHSSLSRLKHLPFKILKVDRVFVAGIGKDRKDEGGLQALITLSRGLDLDIVAEGVETVEQMDWLIQAGYTHLQGYLLGHPVPLNLSHLAGCCTRTIVQSGPGARRGQLRRYGWRPQVWRRSPRYGISRYAR